MSTHPSELPLCDIVMEGGVTSGVIYPRAVVKLSERFRIKNIGGTSAGAIAAAVTAAAELGRARDPAGNPGYRLLAELPAALQRTGSGGKGTTRLLDLFQPSEATRPLLTLLVAALNAKTTTARVLGLCAGALDAFKGRFWLAFGLPLLLTFALGHRDVFTYVLSGLLGLVFGVVTLSYSFWRVLTHDVVENGYGICRGYEHGLKLTPGDRLEPLTLWLSRLINQCAAKQPDDPPLTFGELWAGDGSDKSEPPAWLASVHLTQWRYIDLQMMTTNVTHGRPYRFPFIDQDQKLFFKPSELRRWFPDNVVDHMVDPTGTKSAEDRAHRENEIVPLPDSRDLPVVFVARLSLSFPLLLSAVPLWAPDYEAHHDHTTPNERCWFSDGGISSNFPIHFFDAALPLWPTFGLKLEDELKHLRILPLKPRRADADSAGDPRSNSKDETNRFFMPARNEAGRGEGWRRFDKEPSGAQQLFGFAVGLFDAARNWRDSMLTRAPGVRDRVVRIYLKEGEGGLNLNMNPKLLAKLTSLGEQAAERLIERFEPDSRHTMNMDNHRWVRLRNLSAVLERDLGNVHHAIGAQPPGLQDWDPLIRAHRADSTADPSAYAVTALQEKKLHETLKHLRELSAQVAAPPSNTDGPKRALTVRIVPNV